MQYKNHKQLSKTTQTDETSNFDTELTKNQVIQ